jgi:hypothetical protein
LRGQRAGLDTYIEFASRQYALVLGELVEPCSASDESRVKRAKRGEVVFANELPSSSGKGKGKGKAKVADVDDSVEGSRKGKGKAKAVDIDGSVEGAEGDEGNWDGPEEADDL